MHNGRAGFLWIFLSDLAENDPQILDVISEYKRYNYREAKEVIAYEESLQR